MRPPCEIVVNKLLPAIRALLVKKLIERHEFSQKEVADRLGVTQAAVSQYLSSTRGNSKLDEILENEKIRSKIEELSDKISKGNKKKKEIIKEFCKICKSITNTGIICNLHKESIEKLAEEECEICFQSGKPK